MWFALIQTFINMLAPYKSLGERMRCAIEYLESTRFEELPIGRHVIQGDNIYGLVSDYLTCDPSEREYESHKKYIDFHLVIVGEEQIYCCENNKLNIIGEYIEERDKQRYEGTEWDVAVRLQKGMVVILFPSDVHKVGLTVSKVQYVKKLVLKVNVD